MNRTFGPNRHPDYLETETPVGEACFHCTETIIAEDTGWTSVLIDVDGPRPIVMHHACYLRGVVGSLSHQRGECSCNGKHEPEEPAGMTKRQEAELAVRFWMKDSQH